MDSAEELLWEGIRLAGVGRRKEALTLFKRAVIKEPHNEVAWLWLAELVDGDEDRVRCLDQVLRINPANTGAQERIASLREPAARMGPREVDDSAAQSPVEETVGPGESIEQPATTDCWRCGAHNPANNMFCGRCGASLAEPSREAASAPAASLGGVEREPSSKDRETKRGCGSGWLLVGGGGAMLVVVAALVVASAFGLIELPGLGLPVLQRAPFMSSEPGSLSGTVSWETRGAGSIVVTGVTVKVWAADGLAPIATGITDASGNYSIANIVPGEYRVSAHQYASEVGEQIVRKCWVIDDVVIESGRTTQVFLNIENSLLEVQMPYHSQECR